MKNSIWLERLGVPGLMAVGQTATLLAWVHWSAVLLPLPGYDAARVALVLGGLFLLGHTLTRWVADRHWRPWRVRLVLGLGGGVAVLLSLAWAFALPSWELLVLALFASGPAVSPALLTLVGLGFQWWQGLRTGQTGLGPDAVQEAFYTNLGLLGILLVLNAGLPALPLAFGLWALLLTFGAGLGSLALMSVLAARRAQGAAGVRLSRVWLGGVGLLILSFVLGGLLLSLWLAPDSYAQAQAFLAWVLDGFLLVLALAVGVVALPLSYVFFPLVEWLWRTFNLDPVALPPLEALPERPEELAEVAVRNPAWLAVRDNVAGVVLVGGLLLLFWLAARALPQKVAGAANDEQHESVFSRSLLREQLQRLFNRAAAAKAPALYLTPHGAADDPRHRIRRAYQAMLAWAQTTLGPRPATQTPQAYAHYLAQHYPQAAPAVHTLTAAYEQARYATHTLSPELAQQAGEAVEQLMTVKPLEKA